MKFLIPDIGFTFELTEDLKVGVLNESRNMDIIKAYPKASKEWDKFLESRPKLNWSEWNDKKFEVIFEKGTILKVSRVYIRKGASEFSSVTFNIIKSPQRYFSLKKDGGVWSGSLRSFFLHLEDVHAMRFKQIKD